MEPNETWLNGHYKNGEINTALSYVAVNEPEWFFQGDSANEVIADIHEIWLQGELTQEEAFDQWIFNNLY